MNQTEITPETLAGSVISVPPLARNADFSLNHAENEKLIRHLEGGGVSTLLYGGNAILYHVALSEYAELLQMMTDLPNAGTRSFMLDVDVGDLVAGTNELQLTTSNANMGYPPVVLNIDLILETP